MPDDERTDCPSASDALFVRARTDRESFGQVYDLYYERMYRYCLRRLFRRCAAEEACSEVFLYVAAHIREFRGKTEQEFRCWLYRIAANTANAFLRQSRRRNELLQAAVDRQALTLPGAANKTNPEEQDWPAVYRAVMQLTEREQTLVSLRFFEGLSHDDIAATLGMRPGAVRVAVSRAVDKLRRQFVSPADAKPAPQLE